MDLYAKIVDRNEYDLPTNCPGHLLTLKEKVAACQQRADDGHDIAHEAVTLCQQAGTSAAFAQQMVRASAKINKCFGPKA